MYVYDSDCHCDACSVAGETRYDRSASSSYIDLGKTANITYGHGFTDGLWAKDVVNWGEMNVSAQSFGE